MQPLEWDMRGRVCMVTGASSGLGKAICMGLARRRAAVVMVSRDRQRGEVARADIVSACGDIGATVDLLVADLASRSEVRRLAAEFREQHGRLHVLVNNAGVQLTNRTLTVDGMETTFAVNHLAPFFLTNLLLDLLKASAPSRVITVSSLVHRWGEIDFDDLQTRNRYTGDRAYNRSKLANVLFTRELARRLLGTGVTANSLEPGLTRTNFARDFKGFARLMSLLMRPFMATPEQAAMTLIYMACAPELEQVTGEHFAKMRPAKSSAASRDAALAKRLWDASAQLVGLPNC